MNYIINGTLGIIMLVVLVWLAHRLRMWQRGEERDGLRSDSRAQDEAEVLTRSGSPFI